jgi:hypothetical protein
MNPIRIAGAMAVLCAAALLAACAGMSAPPETYDGLVLVDKTEFSRVYKRPGVDLSSYQTYGLERCEVAFRKNWLRDQNSSRLDLGNRVTQKDVDRIKDTLSDECDKYFRAALEQKPPYQLVDSFNDGESVLVLRPAIINLDIAAPDTFSAGMQRTYTTEAGEMTLVLELLDGTTGEILVRAVDRQRGTDNMTLRWTNSVTNQAAARRILRYWASVLRRELDKATSGARTAE